MVGGGLSSSNGRWRRLLSDAGHECAPVALPATDGTAVNLAALRGRSIVIVYPWTGRPGFPNPPDWDLIPGAQVRRPSSRAFASFMGILRKRICGSSA